MLARWHAVSQPAVIDEVPASSVAPADLPPVEADRGTRVATPSATAGARSAGSGAPLELRVGLWPAWIMAIWSAILLLQLGRIAWSYAYLRQVKRRSHTASPELRRSFDAWMMSCRVHRPTRLLVSSEILSPMAVGFRHPAVILPAPLLQQFQEAELDHVLLHELAHIARRDDWWNLYARLASAVLALHPVAACVLRQIEREREIACDDWVVTMTGDARPYAASLARLFEVCFVRRRMLLASGMAGRASHLGERIEMLLRRTREFTPKASIARVAVSTTVLLVFAIAAAQAPRWLAFAQEAPLAPAAPAVVPEQMPPAPAAPVTPEPSVAPEPPVASEGPTAPPPPAIAGTPGPAPAVAPQMPYPPVASTPAPSEAQAYVHEMRAQIWHLENLRAVLAAQAKTYGPQYPGLVNIRQQIAMLENQVRVAAASTPQPGPASSAARGGSFLAALVDAGYDNLSVDEIINLKNAGVTAQFLTGISQAGWGRLSIQEIIELSNNGVNPEYIRKMKDAGIRDLTLKDVREMANSGVRPETIEEIHALGFGPYTAKQAIQFAQYGLRPELFRALKEGGLGNASPADILEAQMYGLNAHDLREAKQYGSSLTLKQIIKLKMAGVL
jgi:beta-lactamase regulating signal transducer with metallopeptidase domain